MKPNYKGHRGMNVKLVSSLVVALLIISVVFPAVPTQAQGKCAPSMDWSWREPSSPKVGDASIVDLASAGDSDQRLFNRRAIGGSYPEVASADEVAPEVQWSQTFGGSDNDSGWSVQQTDDGGFIIAGYTWSFGDGVGDVYLIKTDQNGNQEWSKTFGGPGYDRGYSVQQTTDDGFIITGYTCPLGGNCDDVYLIKTDQNGNQEWSKTFGGSDDDEQGYSVDQTADGGFAIAGRSRRWGVDESDVYLIKTDQNGNQEWSKTFGGSDNDYANSVQQTDDGGFIIGGLGQDDVYLIKTDQNGNQEWSKTFGGPGGDIGYSVQQTDDGGFIIGGHSKGNVYLIKTDQNGNQEWSKTFGGSGNDCGSSVQQTDDGGFIIAGYTSSFGGGDWDVYLIKTDQNGNQEWSKTFGGSDNDRGWSVQQTDDGGFIIAGYTSSFGDGADDVYLIKLGPSNGGAGNPDLVITDISCISEARVGDEIAVNFTVKNIGDATADEFGQRWATDPPQFSGENYRIDSLAPGETETFTVSFLIDEEFAWWCRAFYEGLVFMFYAEADVDDVVAESNEDNNSREELLTFGEAAEPDLVITDISWSPASPEEGDLVDFTVHIENQGSADALTDFDLWFGIDGGGGYWTLPSLEAGSSTTRQSNWEATPGSHTIAAYVDSEDSVTESNEDNNSREETFTVSGGGGVPDLVVTDISCISEARVGDEIAVNFTVKNIGDGTADEFGQRWATDPPPFSRENYRIHSLAPGETKTFTAHLTIVEQFARECKRVHGMSGFMFTAVADVNDEVIERDEANNVKRFWIPLKGVGADLAIEIGGLDKLALGEKSHIQLRFSNQGDTRIPPSQHRLQIYLIDRIDKDPSSSFRAGDSYYARRDGINAALVYETIVSIGGKEEGLLPGYVQLEEIDFRVPDSNLEGFSAAIWVDTIQARVSQPTGEEYLDVDLSNNVCEEDTAVWVSLDSSLSCVVLSALPVMVQLAGFSGGVKLFSDWGAFASVFSFLDHILKGDSDAALEDVLNLGIYIAGKADANPLIILGGFIKGFWEGAVGCANLYTLDIQFIKKCAEKGYDIFFAEVSGPADVLITDEESRRVGICNEEVYEEMEGSVVARAGERTALIIPWHSNYKIEISRFDTSTANILIMMPAGKSKLRTVEANISDLTAETIATINISSENQKCMINIDRNGDGNIDEVMKPDRNEVSGEGMRNWPLIGVITGASIAFALLLRHVVRKRRIRRV